jgi:hypothetical protein
MFEHIYFYLALSFILLHEMDAMRQQEWLIFPGLSYLDEKTGYVVFTILHLPLYFFLLVGLQNPESNAQLIKGLDIFFMIHVGLHLLFLKHPKNPFKSVFSWSIIILAGVFGGLDWWYL